MSKSVSKTKRRAVSVILFAAAKGLEVSTDKLKAALSDDLRGGLLDEEYDRIESDYKHARKLIDHIRQIAQRLWDTSKKK